MQLPLFLIIIVGKLLALFNYINGFCVFLFGIVEIYEVLLTEITDTC